MTTKSKLEAGTPTSLKLRVRGHRRWPHRQHPQHQEARLCPDRHFPSCRGMRSRLCLEEDHVSQRRLDDIPCLWPPLCNSLYNNLCRGRLNHHGVGGHQANHTVTVPCCVLPGSRARWISDHPEIPGSRAPGISDRLEMSGPWGFGSPGDLGVPCSWDLGPP